MNQPSTQRACLAIRMSIPCQPFAPRTTETATGPRPRCESWLGRPVAPRPPPPNGRVRGAALRPRSGRSSGLLRETASKAGSPKLTFLLAVLKMVDMGL